jgi:two-component system cell cycle response regulator DivK
MKSVLVVEDDEANRALVAKYLKREGYRVLFAQDGLRGVELAQAEAPDLILMDLELPELNG